MNDRAGHEMRSADTREAHQYAPMEYRPVKAMQMPDLGPHVHTRWARARLPGTGDWDFTNLSNYFQQRWRPVRPTEIPPEFAAQRTTWQGQDVVMNGDMMLMINSKDFADSRRKYYSGEVRRVVDDTSLQGVDSGGGAKLPTVAEDRGSKTEYGYRK